MTTPEGTAAGAAATEAITGIAVGARTLVLSPSGIVTWPSRL